MACNRNSDIYCPFNVSWKKLKLDSKGNNFDDPDNLFFLSCYHSEHNHELNEESFYKVKSKNKLTNSFYGMKYPIHNFLPNDVERIFSTYRYHTNNFNNGWRV